MKQKMYFTVLAVIMTLSMISCTEEEEFAEQTLKDRVNSAKIISGEFPFSQDKIPTIEIPSGSFLYIPTPSSDGYLRLETNSKEEKYEILRLIDKRFEKEFGQVSKNDNNSNGRTMSTRCSEWQPTNPDDPNSGVSRICNIYAFDLIYVDSYVETCVCGYCC